MYYIYIYIYIYVHIRRKHLDVIEGVDDAVEPLPEGVVVHVLRQRRHAVLIVTMTKFMRHTMILGEIIRMPINSRDAACYRAQSPRKRTQLKSSPLSSSLPAHTVSSRPAERFTLADESLSFFVYWYTW